MKIKRNGTLIIKEKFFVNFTIKFIAFCCIYAVICGIFYMKDAPFWFYLIFLPVGVWGIIVQRGKVKIGGNYITDTVGKMFSVNDIFSVYTGDDGTISVYWLTEDANTLLKQEVDLEDNLDLTVFPAENFDGEDLEYLLKFFTPYKENYLKYYPDYTEHCKNRLAKIPSGKKEALRRSAVNRKK